MACDSFQNDGFDTQFANAESGLTYLPWVGARYHVHPHPLLIVAESVYNSTDDHEIDQTFISGRTFARKVILDHCLFNAPGSNQIRGTPTYRNLECALLGKSRSEINDELRERLWTGTALHQLVQKPMAHSKARPTILDRPQFTPAWVIDAPAKAGLGLPQPTGYTSGLAL